MHVHVALFLCVDHVKSNRGRLLMPGHVHNYFTLGKLDDVIRFSTGLLYCLLKIHAFEVCQCRCK